MIYIFYISSVIASVIESPHFMLTTVHFHCHIIWRLYDPALSLLDKYIRTTSPCTAANHTSCDL